MKRDLIVVGTTACASFLAGVIVQQQYQAYQYRRAMERMLKMYAHLGKKDSKKIETFFPSSM